MILLYNTVLCMIAARLDDISKLLKQILKLLEKGEKQNGIDNDGI